MTTIAHVKKSFKNTGNRVWHNPLRLKNIIFPDEKRRADPIQWGLERIREYFHHQEKYFSELKELNKPKKNKSLRINRSEGRESLMRMSLLIFYNLELSTMTVRKDDIQFVSPTLQWLTKDWSYLSLSRSYRALKKLKDAGYITVTKQFEKEKNLYRAFAAIKEVTYKFFKALGLEKNYNPSQSYKRKILEKRAAKAQRRRHVKDMFDKFIPNRDVKYNAVSDKGGKKTYEVYTHTDIEAMRQEAVILYKKRYPSTPVERIVSVINMKSFDDLKKTIDYEKKSQVP